MHKSSEKSAFRIDIFEKAVTTLEEVVNEPVAGKRFVIDACIQRFEYTFELAWKTLKIVLSEKCGIETSSPRGALQNAFQQHLVDNEKLWLDMLDDRNQTTHTYDEKVADHIYDCVKNRYFPALKKTVLLLKQRYGSEVKK